MRKLVSVQEIKSVEPIEGADFIEKVGILGWFCVAKKGEFKVGDKCIYYEIDSLLPDWPEYAFLRKGTWKSYDGRYRLKTIKLKGVVSQGLALPLSTFKGLKNFPSVPVGEDVSEYLDVTKYEPIIPPSLAGEANPFEWPIAKTDEERIQNNPEITRELENKPYYISVKLDGTSGSFMLVVDEETGEPEFHVCSRNLSLKEREGNLYWDIAKKYKLKEKLLDFFYSTGIPLAIQGEIVGPGIQKNKLGLSSPSFFVFNIVNTFQNNRANFFVMREICDFYDLTLVPIQEEGEHFPESYMEDLLTMVEGKYRDDGFKDADPKQEREGWVIRSKDQSISFKVINNKFLLKGGD